MYDAIIQNKPIDDSPSIRQQPRYLTFRFRLVNELVRESRMTIASNNKAMGVYDFANG